MEKQFEIVQETLKDEQGQSFAAVTLAVRGDVKELLDAIARLNPAYGSYAHLVGDALGEGLAALLARAKKGK